MTRKWLEQAALFSLLSIAISAFAGSRLISVEIIALPLVTISIISFVFVLFLGVIRFIPNHTFSLRKPVVVDILTFLLIGTSAVVGRIAESGVLDWYYPTIIVTATVLAFRIAIPPTRVRLQLFEIVLVALVVRAIPWFSYPVYGQDRFHHTAVEYIIASGEIIPQSVTYYANFPAAHRFAASYTLLTGSPFKSGYFSLGIVVALSILGVHLLANYILKDDRGALIAALFVAVSGYHIKAGAEPFAQALFTGLAPFIFYLLIRQDNDWRRVLLLLGLAVFAIRIQNIVPLVLLGVSVAFLTSGWVVRKTRSVIPQQFSVQAYTAPRLVVAVVLVVGFYNYLLAGYLRMQTMRVVWFTQSLFGPDPAGQDVASDTSIAGVPTVTLFEHELPGVLMWAAPVLLSAGILIFTAYLVIYVFLRDKRSLDQTHYIGVTGVIFSIFAIFFVAGSPATRALPSVMVLLSPVVGWVVHKTVKQHTTMGQAFAVLLVACTVTAGVLAPPVAKAELGNDDFRAWMDSDEIAAVEFAVENTGAAQASNYAVTHEEYLRNSRPNTDSELTLERALNKNNPETLQRYESDAAAGKTTVYFSYFGTAYGIPEPVTSKVYDSGNASIYT